MATAGQRDFMVSGSINKLDIHTACEILRGRVMSVPGVESIRLLNQISEMELVSQQIGKGCLGPHFARNMNDIPPDHAMIIAAYNAEGVPVGMCGARYDDRPGWDLKDFLSAHWSRMYPADEPGQFAEFMSDSCMYATGITGPFSYIGDGWIAKDYRGGDLLGLIQRLLILLAFDEWKPELTYGWMRPDKVLAGYAARWGYTIVYPKGIEWRIPPKQVDLRDVYFVGIDRRGIRQTVKDLIHSP